MSSNWVCQPQKIKRDANGALCIYSQDEDRRNSASVTYAILKFWEYNLIVKDDRKMMFTVRKIENSYEKALYAISSSEDV